MAKLIEELVVIKLSKLVKEGSGHETVLTEEQRELLAATAPALIEEVINDPLIVIELADLG
jgi:hypothetical protein